MNKYLRWALLWPVMFFVAYIARILSPLVTIFIVKKQRIDVVKRLNKRRVLLNRHALVWWLSWFGTDDNAIDEYWYGFYDTKSKKTQYDYDNNRLFRWYCRIMWLQRNSAYTFNRKFFGLDKNSPYAWQIKIKIPLLFSYYNDVNIGYKAHKGFDRLMYAGRIIGLRKTKEG